MSTNVSEISKYYLEEVLAKGKNFPSGTWKCDEKYENAKNVTKTLIERVLKWTYEDIRNKLTLNIFKKYSVLSMLVKVFNGSPYLAIENAYPGKFKPWELPCVSNSFWNLKTAKEATIWLIEDGDTYVLNKIEVYRLKDYLRYVKVDREFIKLMFNHLMEDDKVNLYFDLLNK